MWLECPCGERAMLAKSFGSWEPRFLEKLEAFLLEHSWCGETRDCDGVNVGLHVTYEQGAVIRAEDAP
jgi:hypothetical protein